MAKVSAKVAADASAFKAVYQAVDQRSEGRCEVSLSFDASGVIAGGNVRVQGDRAHVRCRKRGTDHHHLYKPRRAHHTADQVIHACRACHDRMDWPFKRGRLVYVGRMGSAFLFAIRYTSDKAFRAAGTLTP